MEEHELERPLDEKLMLLQEEETPLQLEVGMLLEQQGNNCEDDRLLQDELLVFELCEKEEDDKLHDFLLDELEEQLKLDDMLLKIEL